MRVDPRAKTARADAGATWGDFNYATHAFGLATTGGIISTTGISGLTLGGGIGYLARGAGLSIDNLISADVVTADGKFLVASERENEDLFWGLRGGGGNFGVVTSFEYRLHEVDQVFAGPLFYNLEDAAAVLRMFDEFIRDAPEEFGGFPGFQIAPPLPFIPENRHGDTLCLVVVHWAGPLDQAERVLKPFRDVAPIVADGTGPLPYPALNGAFDALYPKGLRAYWKGAFVKDLPDAAIAAHVEHGSKVPEVTCTMHMYPINGACHRVGPNDTAFAYRDATYGMVFLAGWTDPAKDAERIKWLRDYHQALSPYSEPGGYINFMQDDDYGRIRDNYRQNYDRLVQVKRAYDPRQPLPHEPEHRAIGAAACGRPAATVGRPFIDSAVPTLGPPARSAYPLAAGSGEAASMRCPSRRDVLTRTSDLGMKSPRTRAEPSTKRRESLWPPGSPRIVAPVTVGHMGP